MSNKYIEFSKASDTRVFIQDLLASIMPEVDDSLYYRALDLFNSTQYSNLGAKDLADDVVLKIAELLHSEEVGE